LCRFPDPWFDDQVSDYHQSVSEIVENIPAVFNLVEELSRDDQEPELAGLKERVLTVRTVTRWAPFLPVVLLLLILALAVRSLKALGNWWGIPLAIGGALLLLVALLYRSLITAALVSGPLQQVPTLVLQESIAAVTRLAEEVFRPLTWQSLVVFILGLILIVVGAAVKPKAEQAAAEAPR
jgi:phosphoglycerol transferase MdoB-like AlkP superfamily enzyme